MEAEEIALSDSSVSGFYLQHIKGDFADVVGGIRNRTAELADSLIDPDVLDSCLCLNHS